MAINIFDKFGIKEVANVYFEALEDDMKAGVYKGDIVLYLDTLKVSTIETTAENTAAQGGWGNPKLIQWDYGKEITVTLEDALISLESLRFMLGGAIKRSKSDQKVLVHRTEEVVVGTGNKLPLPKDHLTGETLHPKALEGHPIRFINYGGNDDSTSAGLRTQIDYDPNATGANANEMVAETTLFFKNPAAVGNSELKQALVGDHIRIFWVEEVITDDSAIEVTISPDTFPGTYKVVGDTFMRSEKTGKDEAFQFIISKAKVQSEVTITLEAEGDPSTFEMTLDVLRATGEDGNEMMKLVRYGAAADSTDSGNDIGSYTGS